MPSVPKRSAAQGPLLSRITNAIQMLSSRRNASSSHEPFPTRHAHARVSCFPQMACRVLHGAAVDDSACFRSPPRLSIEVIQPNAGQSDRQTGSDRATMLWQAGVWVCVLHKRRNGYKRSFSLFTVEACCMMAASIGHRNREMDGSAQWDKERRGQWQFGKKEQDGVALAVQAGLCEASGRD